MSRDGSRHQRPPSTSSVQRIESLLESLNPEQKEAVEHFEGPCLVLAGAGSGKTRVLTTRVCRLIREHGVPPGRIMAVTFTNKAAGEMRERVTAMLGGEPRGIWMGTFHALGARLLRRHAPELGWSRGFAIRDAEQSLREVKRAQIAADVNPRRWKPKAIRGRISDAKNQLVGPEAFSQAHGDSADLIVKRAARVYPVYQQSVAGSGRHGFRRPPAAPGQAPGNERTPAAALSRALRVSSGRRIPGHQPGPVQVPGAACARSPEPDGGGRRRPEHLRVARRRHPQHPRLRAELSGCQSGQVGAELPVDPGHPGRGQRGDLAEP